MARPHLNAKLADAPGGPQDEHPLPDLARQLVDGLPERDGVEKDRAGGRRRPGSLSFVKVRREQESGSSGRCACRAGRRSVLLGITRGGALRRRGPRAPSAVRATSGTAAASSIGTSSGILAAHSSYSCGEVGAKDTGGGVAFSLALFRRQWEGMAGGPEGGARGRGERAAAGAQRTTQYSA